MNNQGEIVSINWIPGQKAGDIIYFKIYAIDNESHISMKDNNGFYFSLTYQEPQEGIAGFNVALISFLLLGLIMIYYKRIKKKN